MRGSHLSAAEEVALARVIQDGGPEDLKAREAVSRLVEANDGLVWYVAIRHKTSHVSQEDLVQEGFLGLTIAAWRFCPDEFAVRFNTYAFFWIKQTILRAIQLQASLVRLPAHVDALLSRVLKAQRSLRGRLGRQLSMQAAMDAAGVKASERDRLLDAMAVRRMAVFRGDALAQTASMRDARTPLDNIDLAERMATARRLVSALAPPQQYVVRCLYGIDAEQKSLREIAADLRIGRQAATNIRNEALWAMRALSEQEVTA
jgi:RNA polymerase sigma factor (sigma-70 family)